MTTVSEAVDTLKDAAMKLNEERKKLSTAHEVLREARDQEVAARKKYAVALGELEQLTGGYS